MKMKKRLLSVFLALLMVVFMIPLQAGAITNEEVLAPSAAIMEAQTGKFLFEKNSHEPRSIASVTKVMTLLLVMEAIDSGKIALTDVVTASDHAASMGGSDIWLKPGETMSVDDLLKATVIASANDAAVALAEHVAGTEDDFIQQMNKKASELGMKDTVFKNCNGLDEDGHVSSAYDVALMSAELLKHPKILDYTLTYMDYLRDGKTQLVNTNKLINKKAYNYNGITGLKTGTTGKAGSCISATAERDNVKLVAVVLGSGSTDDRFKSAVTLLDYGFANWSMSTPTLPENALEPVKVINGMKTNVATEAQLDGMFLVPKGQANQVTSEVTLNQDVEAPVQKGQNLGKITYKLGENVLGEFDIQAKEDIPKITFFSALKVLIKGLLTL